MVRCVLGCVVLALATVPRTAGQDKPTEAVRQAILKLVNAYRQAEGRQPLQWNKKLDQAAQKHASALAQRDRLGDDNKDPHILDGKDVDFRVEKEGYAFAEVAENAHISPAAADLAAEAVKSWKASKGHNRNMLDARFTETGVGAARSKSGKWYLIQVFAKPEK
jgi:uncharacterized protein YkwD